VAEAGQVATIRWYHSTTQLKETVSSHDVSHVYNEPIMFKTTGEGIIQIGRPANENVTMQC
jgi:hypothetical protein